MKNVTLFIALFVFGGLLNAQTIPNQGFETWVNNNESSYTYSVPQGWISIDAVQTTLNDAFGNPGYVSNSVTQSSGSQSGSYAVQMAVVLSNQGDTVPGLIFSEASAGNLIGVLFGAGNAMGFASSTRPASLGGFYKFTRVSGDSAAVAVVMTKWNTSTNMRDTLTYIDNYYITTNTTSYLGFSIPLTYALNVYPDTVVIFTGISSDVPHPGSIFTLDNLAFSGSVPIGISESEADIASVMILPNPFNQQTELKIAEITLDNATLEIYDVLGNKVRDFRGLNGNSVMIDREGLSNGIYFFSLINQNTVISTGKLSIE